ncbi:MAG TPA: hypothetical protein PL033_15775 [Candidatus Brocadiia bacterium]|nr:hypothetical protein [Candidatus Brocadiia bacterium]
MATLAEELKRYVGKAIVIDTAGSLVYIGTLAKVGSHLLCLEHADVHDLAESNTTREVYLYEAARVGLQPNRRAVMVRIVQVMSITALEDFGAF